MNEKPFLLDLVDHASERLQSDPAFRADVYAIQATTTEGRRRLSRMAISDPSSEVRQAALHALTARSNILRGIADAARENENRLAALINQLSKPVEELRDWLHKPRQGGQMALVLQGQAAEADPTIARGQTGSFHWHIEQEAGNGLSLFVETDDPTMDGQVLQILETSVASREDIGFLGLLALRPSTIEDGWWEGRQRIDSSATEAQAYQFAYQPFSPDSAVPLDVDVLRGYRRDAESTDPASLPVWDRWLEQVVALDSDDDQQFGETIGVEA